MATDIKLMGAGGEYMDSVTVVEWQAAVGDRVSAGDVLVVVETAKASTEVEAPVDGILEATIASVGDEVPIGAVLGRIGDGSGLESVPGRDAPAPAPTPARPDAASPEPVREAPPRVKATPLARRIAKQNNIDLHQVIGTGPGGRIKSRDLEGRPTRTSISTAEARPGLAVVRPNGNTRTPVVMLHGFAADASAWTPVIGALGPGFETLCVELPGHGRSPASGETSLDQLAEAVRATLEREGVSSCHLVAHSLGAAVALQLIGSGGLQVASVTCLASAGLGPDINGAFLSGLARAQSAASLAPWLRVAVANADFFPRGYAEAVMTRRPSQSRAFQAELVDRLFPDGTQSFDVRAALGQIRCPTKMIWGRADKVIHFRHAFEAPAHTGIHLIEGVGHMPHLEAPQLVARLVGEAIRAAG